MQFLTIGWKKKEKEKKLNTLVAISDQKGLKKTLQLIGNTQIKYLCELCGN